VSNILFRGIMPALITPFDGEGSLLKDGLQSLMDFELSKGVRGFYINGSTGEGPILPAKRRMAMAEACVEANNGRGVIINHIASPDFEDALLLARHARTLPIQAISALAPNFYFGYTDDEIVDYYARLADAAELPLLVYATPSIQSPDIVSLMDRVTSLPHVIGLKFTRYSYYELSLIKQLHAGDINVINGPDEMLLSGLAMGADGGIGSTYNVMPDRFVALYDSFMAGDLNKAREIQYGINRVIRVLLKYGQGNVIKSVKEALQMMGFDIGYAAAPAAAFTPEYRETFRTELLKAGLTL